MNSKKPFVHYSQVTGELRVYDDHGGFAQKLSFAVIVGVLWISEEEVMLRGAHGEVTRRRLLEVFKTLWAMGAKRVTLSRSKGRGFPYGERVTEGIAEDWYRVDLEKVMGNAK